MGGSWDSVVGVVTHATYLRFMPPPAAPVPSSPARAPDVARSVLVVGTDDWAVEQAGAQLADAGHGVLTCHPPGQPAFPCNAMVDGRTCPLDVGFDVVVSVRARHLDSPSVGELGAVCGLRAGATLVLAGMTRGSPFAPWASAVAEGGDLVASVAQALSGDAVTAT